MELNSLSKYQCPICNKNKFIITTTYWECFSCHAKFECIEGIPVFYSENNLSQHDRELKKNFYNGLIGRFYQFMMPLLVLPVRPISTSWKQWLFYFFCSGLIVFLMAATISKMSLFNIPTYFYLSVLLAISGLLYRHLYLFYLFLLAIPVKIITLIAPFSPEKSFTSIHQDLFSTLRNKNHKIELLDISTGSCNSLINHGWLALDANFTGVDLSEVMLKKGVQQITEKNQAMNFVLAEASTLPFASDFFDVTLNYGAVNGYANIEKALQEMLRVTKKGGLILLFDENLYQHASWLEKLYFEKVLSSHDTIKHCPQEYLPVGIKNLSIYQTYQFYFLLTAIKA